MAMETSKSSKTEAILDLYDALRHGERVQRQDWCQEHGLTTKTFERYMANLRDHLYEKNMRTGQRQAIDFNQETETYSITGKENTWISDSELIAICKILIAVRAFDKKDLISLLSRLLTVVVSKKGKEEMEELMKMSFISMKIRLMSQWTGISFSTLSLPCGLIMWCALPIRSRRMRRSLPIP